jgi:hypothetical protein
MRMMYCIVFSCSVVALVAGLYCEPSCVVVIVKVASHVFFTRAKKFMSARFPIFPGYEWNFTCFCLHIRLILVYHVRRVH